MGNTFIQTTTTAIPTYVNLVLCDKKSDAMTVVDAFLRLDNTFIAIEKAVTSRLILVKSRICWVYVVYNINSDYVWRSVGRTIRKENAKVKLNIYCYKNPCYGWHKLNHEKPYMRSKELDCNFTDIQCFTCNSHERCSRLRKNLETLMKHPLQEPVRELPCEFPIVREREAREQ